MHLRIDRVVWIHCTPRERWSAFYTLYRLALKSNWPFGTGYQCFLILLPDHPEILRMMWCVMSDETGWVDVSIYNPLRRLLFDRSIKMNEELNHWPEESNDEKGEPKP